MQHNTFGNDAFDEHRSSSEAFSSAEKGALRLKAESNFTSAFSKARETNPGKLKDISSPELGMKGMRVEEEGYSLSKLHSERDGSESTALSVKGEDEAGNPVTQVIEFRANPDMSTTVLLDGAEVDDPETAASIDGILEHVSGDSEQSMATAPVAATESLQDEGVIDRAGIARKVRDNEAARIRENPGTVPSTSDYPTVNWKAGTPEELQQAYDMRKANVDAAFAEKSAQRNIDEAQLDMERRFANDVESYVHGQADLQQEVSEQINRDKQGRDELQELTPNEVDDRIDARTEEAVAEVSKVAENDLDARKEIVEQAASAVEGEHIVETDRTAGPEDASQSERLQDARADVYDALETDASSDADTEQLEALEYEINQETSGAERQAAGEDVRKVERVAQQHPEQQPESEEQIAQRKKAASGALNHIFGSPAGKVAREALAQQGVAGEDIRARLEAGEIEVSDNDVRQLVELARNTEKLRSSIWQQPYNPNIQPKSQLEKAALEQQTQVAELMARIFEK